MELGLGSARLSDPRLPVEGILRLVAVAPFEIVHEFFSFFGPEPIARIDRLTMVEEPRGLTLVEIQINPQGPVLLECEILEPIPIPGTS